MSKTVGDFFERTIEGMEQEEEIDAAMQKAAIPIVVRTALERMAPVIEGATMALNQDTEFPEVAVSMRAKYPGFTVTAGWEWDRVPESPYPEPDEDQMPQDRAPEPDADEDPE